MVQGKQDQNRTLDVTHATSVEVRLDTHVFQKEEVLSILGLLAKEMEKLTRMLPIVLVQGG